MDKKKREELTEFCESANWADIADRLFQLKQQQAKLDSEAKTIKTEIEFVCRDLIPDKMAEQGMRGVPLEDGSRIELRNKAFCSVKADKREALFEWLQQNDFESLITEVVNPSTLKAFVKEQREAVGGLVPPDDIVSYLPFVEATLVGRKA
jgi:hypothetical protein